MHDFKVGDRVEYFGPMQEKRGKTYTIKGFMSGTADVDGDPSFGPLLHNLRLITRTPDVITINRADLPEVEVNEGGWVKSANNYLAHVDSADPTTLRRIALQYLSAVEFLEAREKDKQEAAAAEKEAATLLSKRRNDLAKEVAKKAGWNDWEHASYYSHQSEAQAAIDMLIAAEDDRG